MDAPTPETTAPPVRWWRALVAWFQRLWRSRPKQIGVGRAATRSGRLRDVFGDGALELEQELRDILRALASKKGAIVDTVAGAIQDYTHLDRIVSGPGADVDAVLDVTLLADARSALRTIIVRAPEVKVLLEVAGTRPHDRAGREAAGDAMLALRDQRRALQELASAAIRFASSGASEDRRHMDECAKRIANS